MSGSNLDATYGAMLIGVLFATFFQGVLSIQAYVYYENFPGDSRKLKLLVGTLWCTDLLHLILISQATYHYLVTNWGNPAALGVSTWTFDSHLVLLGIATVICQSFFLWRIWHFSNKNLPLIIFLASLCLVTFGIDVYMTIQNMIVSAVSEFQVLAPEVTTIFSVGAASDVIIALLLCYYLRRGGSGFDRTNSIIAHLIRYTVTTGLATSMLAVACLIAYFARPRTFIFIAMHFSLGRMYTNALLATLNSRRSLRATASNHTSIPQHNVNINPGTPKFQTAPRGIPAALKDGVPVRLDPEIPHVCTPQAYSPSRFDLKSCPSLAPSHDQDSDIQLQAIRDSFKEGALAV